MNDSSIRIKYIVPYPLSADGVARRAEQVPVGILAPTTAVTCVPVASSYDHTAPGAGDSFYESFEMEKGIIECGAGAEDEGYHAVVMDTVSDSGLRALRSRLSIPVVGPGQTAYALAATLGTRFGVLTYTDGHKYLYETLLRTYGMADRLAGVRAAGSEADLDNIVSAEDTAKVARFVAAATELVTLDRAHVIVLGSTTLHAVRNAVQTATRVPVVNPGPTALKIAESLVQLGLSHSKAAFPSPPPVRSA